jgi:hypothetical protein
MDQPNMIMDSATVVERQLKNGMRFEGGLYRDSVDKNTLGEAVGVKGATSAVVLKPNSAKWNTTKEYDMVWNHINELHVKLQNNVDRNGVVKNASQFAADYYDLINYLRLDMTRKRADYADYTPMFTQETVRTDMSQKVGLQEFKPYTGVFSEIKGRGDAVPMIEHTTGDERVKYVKLYGLGDSRTLEDELYNLDIWTMQKVNDAFTRAFIGKRNDLCLGRLFTKEDGKTARTYDATYQTQAAISSGSTYDENLYLTILDAYKKLRALKDYQTGQEIDATRAVIVTTYADAWDVQRVIRGQINDNKGKPINLEPMSYITEIWPYRGDVIKANGITTTYAGCASKTAYLIVPGTSQSPAYTMVKRGLTYETGSGNVLTLSREQRVAYFGQCNYLDEFFGGSADTALTAGTGYCVKMTLPSA